MEGDHLEDPDMDGEGKNKMDLREVGWGAQDRNRWRAVVHTVMNLRFP